MGMDTAVIRREVDQFNAINRAVTLQYGCPYLDIAPLPAKLRTTLH